MKITESDVDIIMEEIHSALQETEPQKGEFTTGQYAEKYGLTQRKAYNKLVLGVEMGILARRQYGPKFPIFWKKVK